MSAAQFLDQLRAQGIRVEAAGDRVRLVTAGPPPAELVAEVRRQKLGLLAILRENPPSNTAASGPEDPIWWRERIEERAAIRQFDAGYSKASAQCLAWGEAIEDWCVEHPMAFDAARCAGCGALLEQELLELPDGSRVHWEAEREFACLIAAGSIRRRRAAAALVAMGLTPPEGWS